MRKRAEGCGSARKRAEGCGRDFFLLPHQPWNPGTVVEICRQGGKNLKNLKNPENSIFRRNIAVLGLDELGNLFLCHFRVIFAHLWSFFFDFWSFLGSWRSEIADFPKVDPKNVEKSSKGEKGGKSTVLVRIWTVEKRYVPGFLLWGFLRK